MKVEALPAYTNKVKQLVKPGVLYIDRHHIETERMYREIHEADVVKVLQGGFAVELRQNGTLIWQGLDADGRKLELMLSLLNKEREETIETSSTDALRVSTAYDPTMDDAKLRQDWLKENTDYEVFTPDGRIRRKVKVEIVRKPGGLK